MQAIKKQCGESVDYMPAAAVTGGDVIVINGIVCVATRDIAANTLGSVDTAGVFDVSKITGAISNRDDVYWNPTGDPVGGTAGSGAATISFVAGCVYMGQAIAAAGSSDTTVRVALAGVRRKRRPVLAVTAAGSAQGDAAQLIEGFNVVTGADGTKGVILPTAVAGGEVIVKGVTAGVLKIYPATGGTINALSANAAISLASGAIPVILVASSATQWYTIPLVAS